MCVHVSVHMHSLHPGNIFVVAAVFVVGMDLKVGHGGEVAGFRHHIAAVAHEVVIATVKGGVVWVSRCYAGGCSCMKDGGGRNVLGLQICFIVYMTIQEAATLIVKRDKVATT